jgi:hypothetical protein
MGLKWFYLYVALVVCACNLLLSAQQLWAGQTPADSQPEHIPLVFEPNRGQANGDARFLSRGAAYTVLLGSAKTVLVLSPKTDVSDRAEQPQPSIVTLELLHSNKTAVVEGMDPLAGKSNYFIGKNSANWITGIPQYGATGCPSRSQSN